MKRNVATVADILEFKGSGVITIKADETVGALARRLQQEKIGAMIVSDDGKSIAGIVSERDVAYGLALYRGDLHELPVSTLMTKKVITCKPEDKVSDVAKVMSEFHIRHIPVTSNDTLVGVIGMRDIIAQRLDELQRNTRMIGNVVIAGH